MQHEYEDDQQEMEKKKNCTNNAHIHQTLQFCGRQVEISCLRPVHLNRQCCACEAFHKEDFGVFPQFLWVRITNSRHIDEVAVPNYFLEATQSCTQTESTHTRFRCRSMLEITRMLTSQYIIVHREETSDADAFFKRTLYRSPLRSSCEIKANRFRFARSPKKRNMNLNHSL